MNGLAGKDGAAFIRLMKHYVVDYTNSHDPAQTEFVMEPDYVLRMGGHRLVGRDGAYAAATRKQMEQFPGLGLTVHEIWASDEALMMRFSEHGASLRHNGARASWGGIGLYRWNGERLTANHVEQDYFSRARQLADGEPLPVERPAIAPWDTPPAAPDANAVRVVDAWLKAGDLEARPGVIWDDGSDATRIIDQAVITINEIFSCGGAVGFHASQHGRVTAGFAARHAGREATLHMAGIVHVAEGMVVAGRVIRNRLDLQRALKESQ